MLLTRAYHEDRGEHRHKVLTPDTAHGTNPATVTMAGYEVVKVGTNEDGGVDVDDLRAKADEDVACLMLTNPNTLGLFDRTSRRSPKIVHGVGATLYYDGANLNAVMGRTRPGDMGFDIVHFNLHKTFTQPHGGGGPGSGPIAVSDRIEPYLMTPRVVKRATGSNGSTRDVRPRLRQAEDDRPAARLPGQLRHVRALVRVHPLARRRGPAGRLRDRGAQRELPARAAAARRASPTCCRSPSASSAATSSCSRGAPMKRELGIKTLDLAKRLLDHGFHPPTVYFPLLVDEALLIEPTETETKETLDAFADAIVAILREAREDPEVARNAPYTTPVRRLDEAGAAKRPVIRQPL